MIMSSSTKEIPVPYCFSFSMHSLPLDASRIRKSLPSISVRMARFMAESSTTSTCPIRGVFFSGSCRSSITVRSVTTVFFRILARYISRSARSTAAAVVSSPADTPPMLTDT